MFSSFSPSALHVFISPPQGPTGSIEVSVQEFIVLNPADRQLPFYPSINQVIVRVPFPPSPSHTSRHQHFVRRRTMISALNTVTWTSAVPLCHKTCVNEAQSPISSATSSMTRVRSHHENPLHPIPSFNIPRFPRSRNSHPPKILPRGRPRIPRPDSPPFAPSRSPALLRSTAITAAAQAVIDLLWRRRQVLPIGPVLP